jgi:hypothetical protein
MSFGNLWSKGLHAQCGLVNHLALLACSIPYEKWMQGEKCPSKAHLPQGDVNNLRSQVVWMMFGLLGVATCEFRIGRNIQHIDFFRYFLVQKVSKTQGSFCFGQNYLWIKPKLKITPYFHPHAIEFEHGTISWALQPIWTPLEYIFHFKCTIVDILMENNPRWASLYTELQYSLSFRWANSTPHFCPSVEIYLIVYTTTHPT